MQRWKLYGLAAACWSVIPLTLVVMALLHVLASFLIAVGMCSLVIGMMAISAVAWLGALRAAVGEKN